MGYDFGPGSSQMYSTSIRSTRSAQAGGDITAQCVVCGVQSSHAGLAYIM